MAEPPRTYRVVGHTRRGGSAEIAAGNHTVPVDAGWAVEPTGAPGPAELLAGAFAACLMKNIERSSKLMGFAYDTADVTVTARRQDTPPRFVELTYEVRIATDEPDRRVQLLHRNLRQYGTVYNTLAAVCQINGTVLVTPALAG